MRLAFGLALGAACGWAADDAAAPAYDTCELRFTLGVVPGIRRYEDVSARSTEEPASDRPGIAGSLLWVWSRSAETSGWSPLLTMGLFAAHHEAGAAGGVVAVDAAGIEAGIGARLGLGGGWHLEAPMFSLGIGGGRIDGGRGGTSSLGNYARLALTGGIYLRWTAGAQIGLLAGPAFFSIYADRALAGGTHEFRASGFGLAAAVQGVLRF